MTEILSISVRRDGSLRVVSLVVDGRSARVVGYSEVVSWADFFGFDEGDSWRDPASRQMLAASRWYVRVVREGEK